MCLNSRLVTLDYPIISMQEELQKPAHVPTVPMKSWKAVVILGPFFLWTQDSAKGVDQTDWNGYTLL